MKCPSCGGSLPDAGFAGLCPNCVATSLVSQWDTFGEAPQFSDDTPAVSGWRFIEPVGAGGQGTVWKAVRMSDEREAAVKVFRKVDDEAEARLEREAQTLATLNHPVIVRFLGAGATFDGRLFIATDFIEGCDLSRLLSVEKIAPQRALEITRCLADALGHAHSVGVIHRDLKPANIIIGRKGDVHVVDFSVARRMGEALSVTIAGTAFGTPYYLAPEIIRGMSATASADIYALGVILYQMLSGAPPVGRFSPVSSKCAVPREVDFLIESMLSERPEDRPLNAAAISAKIADIERQMATSSARRSRVRKVLSAGLVLAIAGAAGALGYFAPREHSSQPVPSTKENGFPNPVAASRGVPFVNSIGMQFVPVPGLAPLVSRYETRMDEFRKYVVEGAVDAEWQEALGALPAVRMPVTDLRAAGWEPQTMNVTGEKMPIFSDVPNGGAACGVSLPQARRFCAWLTWREQREGRLSPGEFYRIPTDEEWSIAASLPQEKGATPEERNGALVDQKFPWNGPWPPPPEFGNFGGTEARNSDWPAKWLSLSAVNDPFPRVAPVGSFRETSNGLFDVWGNVWEWCDTPQTQVSGLFVLRGASWVDGGYRPQLRMDHRRFERPALRETTIGFRCVLVVPEREKIILQDR